MTPHSRLTLLFVSVLLLAFGPQLRAQDSGDGLTAASDVLATDAGWPRVFQSDGDKISVYQPQIESWDGNKLTARAAVSVQSQAAATPTYGVVWLTARTDVDKELRLVFTSDLTVTKVNVPAAPDRADAYLALFRKTLPSGVQAISLDRVEANLAVTRAESKTQQLPLKNEPPEIIYSSKPAMLVLIDGKPALRQAGDTGLLRVINTRALILLDQNNGNYYLHFMDRWLTAKAIDGTWSVAQNPPASLAQAQQNATEGKQPVDLLDDPAPDVKDEIEQGTWPAVYVRTTPAELIETQGDPQLAPIDGTQLLWVKNTSSQLLLDTKSGLYYVVLSGRWYRSKELKGPWEFVPADKIPADVAKIPETHPKGDVLASVPGTPQAQQALIANQIPQTATVKKSEAQLSTFYDGDPKFEPIEGTKLSYAVNTPTPVIQTDPNNYYAVENGVWFQSQAAAGPWAVADSVPPAIYTIPPSSPLYYVTFCQVYGATPEVVYVGYTPGYFGTCVAPWGCVVYGTGWYYPPWVGNYWFGRCWTWGYAVSFRWTPWGGWCFGFGTAFGPPWWGPLGWYAGWGGAWRDGWHRGWGGRYAHVHTSSININNLNVYNRWKPKVNVNNLRVPAVKVDRPPVETHRLNNVLADRHGQVLRRTGDGWETITPEGWRNYNRDLLPPERRNDFDNLQRELNSDWESRRLGEAWHRNFNTGGGFGGISGWHGGLGGYRGIGYGGFHEGGGFRFGGFRGGFRR